MRLGQAVSGRDNNFNLIRMIAAFCVLVSHAYPISQGPGTAEPLSASVGMTLGTISVMIFFAVSGLLITQSYDRRPELSAWALARILRIFPGLFVVLALTAFVMGPAVTVLSTGAYFADGQTLSYVPANLRLFSLQYPLPGVFEGNPYGTAINGSLWTLKHEVSCYAGVALLGLIGALSSRRIFWIALAAMVLGYVGAELLEARGMLPHHFVRLKPLALAFGLGIVAYRLRDRIELRLGYALVLAALCVLLRESPVYDEILTLAIAYWSFYLAYVPQGAIRAYNRLGDYSYGTYIYAFPLQQLAMHMFGPMTPWMNMAIAAPLVLVCAVLSWRFVEKPALALKSRLKRAAA